MTSADRLGPGLVEPLRVPLHHRGEVGPDALQIDLGGLGDDLGGGGDRVEVDEQRALGDRVAGADGHPSDDAGMRRLDDVLHLHGLDDRDRGALSYQVTLGDLDADHRAPEG
ncbi:hypothetical protein GCM10020219_026210 [Nonomuraea dietziae]